MENIYFNHHKLLVYGIYLLNQNSVSNEMIDHASLLLEEYVSQFGTLYGDQHMSLNIHLLLHLPQIVKRLGPLWTTSCFHFEDLNGILKRLVHGTKYADLQIYSAVSMFFNQSILKKKVFKRK